MPTFTKSALIDRPRAEVWRTLADLEAVELYSPAVKTAEYTSERRDGIGASRYCDFHGPGSVHERVVQWHEGERLGIGIEKGFPAKNVVADFRLSDVDGNSTRVEVRFTYDPKFGPIGALMDRVMMRSYAEKAMHGLMKGLKHHSETGARQNPKARSGS